MHNFLRLLNRFGRDERGVFAVFFGIIAVVLVATAGAVVDFTTVAQARARAQDALDSATLGLQPRIYEGAATEEVLAALEEDLKDEAQLLLNERLASDDVTATVEDAEIDRETGMLRFSASIGVPTAFVQLVGVNQIDASVVSEVRRGSLNIEVALAMDVTLSMSIPDPSKITALKSAAKALVPLIVKDDQSPNYTKMALVPYSSAVNVGSSRAASVRGAAIQHTTITAASTGVISGSTTVRTIQTISKHGTQPVIRTTNNHGYSTGDIVNISAITGGTNFTALNGKSYTVTRIDSDDFSISANTLGTGTYTGNSGRITSNNVHLISWISEANPAQVTTGTPHGLATGDQIVITSASGDNMDELNDEWFTVTVSDSTHFTIDGEDSNENTTNDGPYNANSGVMRKCTRENCQIEITSPAHGLEDTEHVYINSASWLGSVEGDDEVNNVWEVTDATTDTYVLKDSVGSRMGTYAANGRSWCTRPVTWNTTTGCQYYYFENKNEGYSLHQITTCVTERVDANQYTDAAPSTTFVAPQYPPSLSGCLTPQITPLTSNKATLIAEIDALSTTGSTSGQIGTAWAWYMLAPNFSYLFTGADQQPAAYDAPHTKKIVIIMTDGEYNTPYCNGVVAGNHDAPLSDNDVINCDAQNGSALTQAAALCAAMKDSESDDGDPPPNIEVYTVGFQLGTNTAVINMLNGCASPGNAYLASSSAQLFSVFEKIGNDISDLRLAQ